jgi:SAM-dependent methyltransferase
MPLAESSFDVVVNLFTSFGYFQTDAEHGGVVLEVARVLTPGGWFVLDYLNAPLVRRSLVEYEEVFSPSGKRVVIDRRISEDGRYVFKDMSLVEDGRKFHERVRLFEPQELEQILVDAGFSVDLRYGNYQGDTYGEASPRVLLFSVFG